MIIDVLAQAFNKARSVNQTSNGYVSKIPTATEPSGDAGTATGSSVIELAPPPGGIARGGLVIVPYGAGADNATFSFRVIGWRFVGVDPQTRLWIPATLVEVTATLSTVVGVAGYQVIDTERFADTLILVVGSASVNNVIISPADNTIAHVMVSTSSFQKIELSFTTGGLATNCNALVALA